MSCISEFRVELVFSFGAYVGSASVFGVARGHLLSIISFVILEFWNFRFFRHLLLGSILGMGMFSLFAFANSSCILVFRTIALLDYIHILCEFVRSKIKHSL